MNPTPSNLGLEQDLDLCRHSSPRLVNRSDPRQFVSCDYCRELDHAMLRRLEKRILVDLPNCSARSAMFQHHLPPVVCPKNGGLELLTELDYDVLGMVSTIYTLLQRFSPGRMSYKYTFHIMLTLHLIA